MRPKTLSFLSSKMKTGPWVHSSMSNSRWGKGKDSSFFTKTKERKILLRLREKFFFWVSVSDGFFLTLEIFWFADGCSSYIINVLSVMFKKKFWQRRSSGTILLLACKIDVVDDVNEVSDAGIDDSSVERWLFLYWKPCRILGAEIRVGTGSFIFFRRRDVVWEEK